MLTAGALDPTFDGDGKLTTALGFSDAAYGIAIQTDGKLVVAGYAFNGSDYDFAVARFHSDGRLDTSFSDDGKVTTPIGPGEDVANAVAIQPDGKIIVVGYSLNGADSDFAVVRYNSDGSLDTTFSSDGKLTTPIASSDDYAYSVALQTDGKVVVAGESHDGSNFRFAVARYNSNGSLDTSFSSDGKRTDSILSGDDFAYAVAVQSDGKIIVAGGADDGNDYDFALIRYTASGNLDTSFSSDGKVTTPMESGDDIGYGIALQLDGKIVVAGDGSGYFGVARYNSNGSLDSSFSSDGKQITEIGTVYDAAYAVRIQSDGKIIVAGESDNGTANDFALARYNSNGSLDTTFDGDGLVTTSIGFSSTAYAVALQSDGKIVLAGETDLMFAVARYEDEAITQPNRSPVLAAIGNKSVNEGNLLSFTVAATDPDAGQSLTFSLDSGAPAGMAIDSMSGAFTWTPGEALGPGNYSVTVRVTDNGTPSLNDFELISVTVAEVNSPPTLGAIGDKPVVEGSLLTFTATATDPDLPVNSLTFSLDTGAPAGAAIDASTGVFTWTPTLSQGPATHSMTVRVSDNGAPGLSDSETINISVTQPTVPGLTGDFNRDSHVGAADYVIWRKTLNTTVTPYSGADGDGSGVIDQNDYRMWTGGFGSTLTGIIVTPSSGLVTTEAGATAQFTVVLNTQPTADVTIGLSSSDPTEGMLSTPSLTFTSANWNVPQTVTVTGVDDVIKDGDVAYTIIVSPAISSDAAYNGQDAADVAVVNNDDPGVLPTGPHVPGSRLTLAASGLDPGAETFVVFTDAAGAEFPVLATFVTATTIEVVVPPLLNTETFEIEAGTVSASVVQETAAGPVQSAPVDGFQIGALPQTGIAPGALTAEFLNQMLLMFDSITEDYQKIGDASGGNVDVGPLLAQVAALRQRYSVLQSILLPLVNGQTSRVDLGRATMLNNLDLILDRNSLTLLDQTMAAFVLNQAGGAQLASAIAQPFALASESSGSGSFDPVQAIADQFDWTRNGNVAEVLDFMKEYREVGEAVITLGTLGAAFAFGPPALAVGGVLGTMWWCIATWVPAAQMAGVQGASSTMIRGSATVADFEAVNQYLYDSFWDAFKAKALEWATDKIGFVSERLEDPAQIFLSMMDFTSSVTTLFDPDDSQSLRSRIKLNFGTIIGNLPAKRIIVTPTSGLITTEAGGSATFEVSLEEAPSDTVTINLLSSNTDEGRINKSVLTFTTTNWSPQLVTITGQQDFIDDGDVDYKIFVGTAMSAGDSEYNGFDPEDVTVVNRDDDTAGVTITQSGGSTNVAEGGATDSYTVVLTSQPRANVTIQVSSGMQVSVSPTSRTFTSANWNSPQTFTVTAVDDISVEGSHTGNITHSAVSADPKYNGSAISINNVLVNITDNDSATDVRRFDGSYTGTYGGDASGSVAFTVNNGVINVTQPPPGGSGTVNPDGGATFGVVNGASFSGQFVVNQSGVASASGSWTYTDPVFGTFTGTWNAQRVAMLQTANSAFIAVPSASPSEDRLSEERSRRAVTALSVIAAHDQAFAAWATPPRRPSIVQKTDLPSTAVEIRSSRRHAETNAARLWQLMLTTGRRERCLYESEWSDSLIGASDDRAMPSMDELFGAFDVTAGSGPTRPVRRGLR